MSKKSIFPCFILFLSISLFKCEAQSNSTIPNKYLKNYIISDSVRKSAIIKNKAVDITYCLPKNYSKKGTVDYTKFIQKAILNNKCILLPNFPILINENGLLLKNNSTIIFNKYSKIIFQGNDKENYNIINISNVSNVSVYFAQIVGDREIHNGKTGEWGMGIGIWDSKGINIISPKIINCWGDGIYINNGVGINIISPLLNNNRRNGISIISGKNIKISNMLAANSNATAPMAGLDIEPNNNMQSIQNIVLQNPITYNNYRGLLIVLPNLYSLSRHNIDVTINNPIDDGSRRGIDLHLNKEKKSDVNLLGNILITDPIWINQKEMPLYYDSSGFGNSLQINIRYSRKFKENKNNQKLINNLLQNRKLNIEMMK